MTNWGSRDSKAEARIPKPVGRQSWGTLAKDAIPFFASAFGVLASIFGGFCYFVDLSDKAPVAWVVVAAFVPVSVIVLLIRMVDLAISDSVIPRVQCSLSDARKGILLLLGPSTLFGQGVAVSIYIVKSGFEILIGLGFVLVIQQDQKIQIRVTSLLPDHDGAWDALIKNDADTLEQIVVKPGHQVERGN